ncbi:MAG: YlbF family regulator [Bacillota bacterium]|nr:MAG: hypothetical protein DIU70_07880 [Bacillota bacterium]
MAGILDLATRLGKALKESPENQAYQAAYKRAKADRKAEALLKDLARRQMEMAAAPGQRPDPAKVKELEQLAKAAQANPVAREYLEAEARLNQLWYEILRAVARALGAELPRTPGARG